jgi:restriction endonuclease S subunit
MKIGDFCEVTSSKRIFAKEYCKSGIPFFRSQEVIQKAMGQRVNPTIFISPERYKSLEINEHKIPKRGDILISAIGANRGFPWCVDGDQNFYFKDGNVIWLRNFKPSVSSSYLTYFLGRKCFIEAVQSETQHSAQGAITIDYVKAINIDVPDMAVQRHIVDTIGSVDELIEKHSCLIDKINEETQFLFAKLSQGEAEEKLQKLIKFVKGKKSEISEESGQEYLTIDALTKGDNKEFSSYGVPCNEKDILMVMDGASSGKVFIGKRGYVGSTLAKIESSLPSALLYVFLSSVKDSITKNTSGSAIPHADKGFIGELQIPIITNKAGIQNLEKAIEYSARLETEISILKEEKKILLERYF